MVIRFRLTILVVVGATLSASASAQDPLDAPRLDLGPAFRHLVAPQDFRAALSDVTRNALLQIECESNNCWTSPYFSQRGGFVARAKRGHEVRFAMECGERVAVGAPPADDQRIVRQSLSEANGYACSDSVGVLWVSGIEPGSWYWIDDRASSATTSLVSAVVFVRHALTSRPFTPAVDPGDLFVDRFVAGTFFRHEDSGRVAIVPSLPVGHAAPPCDHRLHLGDVMEERCTLGSSQDWMLTLSRWDPATGETASVDGGRLVLPEIGQTRFLFQLSTRRGFVQRLPFELRARLGAVTEGAPLRGVALDSDGTLLLSSHERCAANSVDRGVVDKGVFVVDDLVAEVQSFLQPVVVRNPLAPPLPSRLDMTLSVSCPKLTSESDALRAHSEAPAVDGSPEVSRAGLSASIPGVVVRSNLGPDDRPARSLRASATVDCDPASCYVTPFFRGSGGFVARARPGATVEFAVECGAAVALGKAEADEAGVVRQALTSSNGYACSAGGGEGVVYISPVEPGGWFWVNAASSSAAAPLVPILAARGGATVEPVDPGGLARRDGMIGSWFEHEESGRVAILPHLSTGGIECADVVLTSREDPALPFISCSLGTSDHWTLALTDPVQEALVDPGKLELPAEGEKIYGVSLFPRDGYLLLEPPFLQATLRGVDGGREPRGVSIRTNRTTSDKEVVLRPHERCLASSVSRHLVDKGLYVNEVVGSFTDSVGILPPLPERLVMTLSVSCPPISPNRGVELAGPPQPEGLHK